MRRNIAVVALVAITALGLAITPAHADTVRVYRGELSDGRSFRLDFHRGPAGNLRLSRLDFNAALTCDDASTMTFGVGYGFGGRGPIVVEGAFSFDDFDFQNALHVHGTIGPRQGSGDFRFTIAALTQDEQAQLCTTGNLTWSVSRTETSSHVGGPTPDVRIRVRTDASVAGRVVRTTGVSAAR
jgi:hypothetical protein